MKDITSKHNFAELKLISPIYPFSQQFQAMSQQIAAMVRRGDAEAIQRYVKTNLPSDQPSLQRIYRQLLHYTEKEPSKPQENKKQKTVRSTSMRALHHKGTDSTEEPYEKRSNGIMRRLKEKGFKVLANDEEEGLKVFQQQRSKLVRPKITNSKLLQGGEEGIDRLIERFNANCDFYGNNIEDVNVDIAATVDRDMREFMDRRQAVLGSLQSKQQLQLHRPLKYAAIPAKVTQPIIRKLSCEQPPSISSKNTSRMSGQQLKSTHNLMDTCQRQIQARKFKEIPIGRNDFQVLQRRLSGNDEQELDLAGVVNLGKVRERMSKEQYQRYTHSYMKMMTGKMLEGSKCKLNPYAKELLQDQRKMRNIIDFSQQ